MKSEGGRRPTKGRSETKEEGNRQTIEEVDSIIRTERSITSMGKERMIMLFNSTILQGHRHFVEEFFYLERRRMNNDQSQRANKGREHCHQWISRNIKYLVDRSCSNSFWLESSKNPFVSRKIGDEKEKESREKLRTSSRSPTNKTSWAIGNRHVKWNGRDHWKREDWQFSSKKEKTNLLCVVCLWTSLRWKGWKKRSAREREHWPSNSIGWFDVSSSWTCSTFSQWRRMRISWVPPTCLIVQYLQRCSSKIVDDSIQFISLFFSFSMRSEDGRVCLVTLVERIGRSTSLEETHPLVMRDAASTIVYLSPVSQRRVNCSTSNVRQWFRLSAAKSVLHLSEQQCSVDEHSFHLSRWD